MRHKRCDNTTEAKCKKCGSIYEKKCNGRVIITSVKENWFSFRCKKCKQSSATNFENFNKYYRKGWRRNDGHRF